MAITITAGMRLTAARLNALAAQSVTRTTDLTRTSTTSATADPVLTLAVVANATYAVDVALAVAADGVPDFKFGFSGPTSATLNNWLATWMDTAIQQAVGATISTTQGIAGQGTGTTRIVYVTGTLVTSSTAGNFAATWAQNASSANSTTLKAGSILTLHRTA